jgi:TolB-like protein
VSDPVDTTRSGNEARLSPDHWRQLETLLDVLLDTPPERRSALFAEVSGGDPERRAELERLVDECERAYPLLDRPASDRFASLVHTAPLRATQVVAERYRIVSELGRGGMATVYLARDLKHARDVALKVVRAEFVGVLGGGRFLREIEIAAQLRHPHIVPLYDSGESDGIVYYVMPYESGQSLRDRIRREGKFSVDDAVSIIRDLCDALAYAHERGVVHRDIKPDNVLLSGRHALVTDFGVARAATAVTSVATSTGAGVIVGTPAYMAPEQVTADPRVDHRADIYAVGVLAYELLAGHPPFSGESSQEVLAAQLTEAAVPLVTHRPDVPPPLAAVVMKCLEKRAADRWQSASAVVQALDEVHAQPTASLTRATTVPEAGPSAEDRVGMRRVERPVRSRRRRRSMVAAIGGLGAVATASLVWVFGPVRQPSRSPVPPPPAVAVLVFQHAPHPELEPLAIGVTANLISALGRVPRLDVRSLQAVWPYRDRQSESTESVGRRLGVPWLVSGRVYQLRGRTVVSVELTEAATGRHLASDQLDAAYGADLTLVDDVVAKVAMMLRARIGDHVRVEGWRAGTRSRDAFASVNLAYRDFREADALMERDLVGARLRLLRADSTFAEAERADAAWPEPRIQRGWIARRLALMLGGGAMPIDSFTATLGTGIAHADAALRIRPGEARALEVRGVLLHDQSLAIADRDSARALLSAAEVSLQQATDADSTLTRGLNVLSSIHYMRGELERARLLAMRAQAADAFSEDGQQLLARLFTIDFDDANDRAAQRWCSEYGQRFPRDWYVGYCRLMLMGWDSTEAPDPDQARRVAQVATADAPAVIRSSIAAQLQILVAGVLARRGPNGGAQRILDDVRATVARDPTIARGPFGGELLQLEAGVRARLGQRDAATLLLREYVKQRPDLAERIARGRRFKDLPIT